MAQKYCIGYNDSHVIRPLPTLFPKMIGYVKSFGSAKTMSFKVGDKKLLEKYTKIWKKISSLISKKIDSEPVYGDNNK